MDLTLVIPYLQHQRLVIDYVYINAIALLIYDYFLTLHLEIKLVWRSRWNYTKVLFLLVRYVDFFYMCLLLYTQVSPDTSPETCRVLFPALTWLLVSNLFLAETILAIRTWAVWDRHRFVGIVLAVAVSTYLFVQCPLANTFEKSVKYGSSPYLGFRGCYVTGAREIVWENYVVLIVIEAVVLVLMLISAFRSCRFGNNGELSHIIHRDGILYYVYLFCISAASLTVTATLPTELSLLLSPLQTVLYSVLTTRIVLDIREVGNRSQETELHTSYYESLVFASPLPVVSNEHDQDDFARAESSRKTQDVDYDDTPVP